MKEMTFEETPTNIQSNTIGEAWLSLWHDPSQFIRYWNYKGAILSGAMRAPIFFVTYLVAKENLWLALGAALVQFIFRFFFAGVGGALIQSFRRVEPPWKALLSILLVVPLISHLFEFLLQFSFVYLTGTNDHTDEAIIRSICFSIISALFTLFIMRRNVMIVGDADSKSFLSDIWQLPFLIFEFVMFIPNEIGFMIRRGAIALTILSIAAFGVFAQMLSWAFTNKMFWTYKGGQQIPFLKFWGIDGIILLLIVVAMSLVYFSRVKREDLV